MGNRALVVCAALLVAGCGGSGQARTAPTPTRGGTTVISVTVGAGGCAPSSTHLHAGPATFEVHIEDGNSVTEVALLKPPIILAELENLPTTRLERSFSLQLPPGPVTLSCPGGKRTRSALSVTGTQRAITSPKADAAVARYRAWVELQAHKLVTSTMLFTNALAAHQLARARALYPGARVYYERVEPIAESFSTLDKQIDARAGDVPARSWTGFHPIERSLWATPASAGTARLSRKLVADVSAVNSVATRLALTPAQIANGAVGLLNEVARSKITGEEERYSHLDLVDFEANVDGSEAAFRAIRGLLPKRSSGLARTIAQRFEAVHRALDPYRRGTGFVPYTALTPADTRRLSRVVDALAEPLSTVSALVLQTS